MDIQNKEFKNFLLENYPDKPSEYVEFCWNSYFKKSELESTHALLMKFLSETGNIFREIKWDEYIKWRGKKLKRKETYFDEVLPYATRLGAALIHSKDKYLKYVDENITELPVFYTPGMSIWYLFKNIEDKESVYDEIMNKDIGGGYTLKYFEKDLKFGTLPVLKGNFEPTYNLEKGIYGWKPQSEDYMFTTKNPNILESDVKEVPLYILPKETLGKLEIFKYILTSRSEFSYFKLKKNP